MSKPKTKKIQLVLPQRNLQMNDSDKFPEQESHDQASSDRSEFAFSSGASLPINSASRLVFGDLEHTSHRINGYGENRLNTNVRQTQHSRQGNISHSSNRPAFTIPPKHPDYVDINERIRTYARWTHTRPDPTSLANAGFFFTNDGDLVRCYQCGIGLKDFCEEDNPLNEHVKHSGSCPYLIEYLGADRLAEIKRQLQSKDPEFKRRVQWSERHRHDPTTAIYRHPEYQTLQARLASFTGWPQHMVQTPQQLADAGLFYLGYDDCVRCFACDGGLKRWDPDEYPWTEHCKWFPACPFARIQKGDDYIAFIQVAVNMENQVQTRCHPSQDRQNQRNLSSYHKYKSKEARVSSFGFWPPQIEQTIEQMAEAGLYYTGSNDMVQCFQCGGNIRGWKEHDDVWTEHARLFPLCPYVRTNKEKEFIARVQATIIEEDDRFTRSRSISFDIIREMGFSKSDYLLARRHLKNTGKSNPTLEDIVNALCKLKN